MRKLAGNLNRTQTLCLFVNQIREKVGVMFGSPETQPGGRALKFYAVPAARHPAHRDAQGRHGGGRQPRPRQGRQEQGRRAVPPGGVRHRVRQGHLHVGLHPRPRASSTRSSRSPGSFFSYGDERLGQGRNNAKALPGRAPRDRQGDRVQGLRGRSASIRTSWGRSSASRRTSSRRLRRAARTPTARRPPSTSP